jgi:hypothetical protein
MSSARPGAPAPGGLLAGGDERAVRRAGERERPSPIARRGGAAQMQARVPEPWRGDHAAGAICTRA